MTFFRPLSETAPDYDPKLPWPMDGLAYVIMFAAIFAGFLTENQLILRRHPIVLYTS